MRNWNQLKGLTAGATLLALGVTGCAGEVDASACQDQTQAASTEGAVGEDCPAEQATDELQIVVATDSIPSQAPTVITPTNEPAEQASPSQAETTASAQKPPFVIDFTPDTLKEFFNPVESKHESIKVFRIEDNHAFIDVYHSDVNTSEHGLPQPEEHNLPPLSLRLPRPEDPEQQQLTDLVRLWLAGRSSAGEFHPDLLGLAGNGLTDVAPEASPLLRSFRDSGLEDYEAGVGYSGSKFGDLSTLELKEFTPLGTNVEDENEQGYQFDISVTVPGTAITEAETRIHPSQELQLEYKPVEGSGLPDHIVEALNEIGMNEIATMGGFNTGSTYELVEPETTG